MAMKAYQKIDERDPLHAHLKKVILPRLGFEIAHPEFRLKSLSKQLTVFLCREQKSNALMVGKFFGQRSDQQDIESRRSLDLEFNNLVQVRRKGLNHLPCQVVRPLGKNKKLKCVLIEEYIPGHDLDYYIAQAAYKGKNQQLMDKLKILAVFLARLHHITAGETHVNTNENNVYFRKLITSLAVEGLMRPNQVIEFNGLCDSWAQDHAVWETRSVMVHGDATPTNFIFHPENGVTAIDLERMRPSDCAYDIGLLAAELKHHYAWRILRADDAETFIRYFIQAYCGEFEDPEAIFKEIAVRNKFFMALGELRIARNKWLPMGHRIWLIEEALRCLKLD